MAVSWVPRRFLSLQFWLQADFLHVIPASAMLSKYRFIFMMTLLPALRRHWCWPSTMEEMPLVQRCSSDFLHLTPWHPAGLQHVSYRECTAKGSQGHAKELDLERGDVVIADFVQREQLWLDDEYLRTRVALCLLPS